MKTIGNRKAKTVFSVICVACLTASLLAACSGKKDSPSASSSTAATTQQPLALNVMMIQQQPEPIPKDSLLIKKLEENTNTKLDIAWVPATGTTYDDKVSATIASGKLPDIMLLRKIKETAALNAQLSGAFWDVTPYLKDYKNLSKMNPIAMQNASVGGKLYGIPRERVLARYGMIFRKDWLDNLGLQQPKTVDDIYKIAKAFTLNDPDKNGKNDTFGIQEDATMELLKQLTVYNGGPNAWGLKDGKITPDFMYPEFKTALDLYRKMVSEKIISPDFPIAKKYDYFNQEKAGIYFSVLDDGGSRHTDLMKSNPKAAVDIASNFDGPTGQHVRGTLGYDSMLVIPKSSVASEAKVKQIIGFLDKTAEEPIQTLFRWGIEGSDYTLENGMAKKIPNSKGAGDISGFQWDAPLAGIKGVRTPVEEKINKMIEDNKQLAVVDFSAALLSDTNTQKGKDLMKAITDAETKFLLGELDDKGWNDAVAKWRKDGGDKIIEEFTADYNKNKSK
jgi:putative aldouronate transport system substrate-binding protein